MARTRTRPRRRSAGRGERTVIGPFTGMRDSLDPTTADPSLARILRNVYPLEPGRSSRIVGRPGFSQAGAQLGGGGDVQYIGQFTELDGTTHTIAIVGGQFYTYNWSTSAWTETLTAANLAAGSVAISTTARVRAVTFANNIVFTDGTNTPWAWDGTANGGITDMTNAPVAYGPPTVYYGKIFFIKNTDRSTFVWSEENALNTGYEAGGYNNAWTLGQTDTDKLTRILGANEALYVWRDRSTTAISGEVNANFSSTGTREAISNTIGTSSPDSVFFDGLLITFADADGRPHVIAPGGQPVPIWTDFRETLRAADSANYALIEGFYDPVLEMGRLCYNLATSSDRALQLCYHSHQGAEIPHAACYFSGFEFTRIGVVHNASGEPRVMHGSTDGYIYTHGTPGGSVWNDGLAAGAAEITHDIESSFVGYSTFYNAHYDLVDFLVTSESDTLYTVNTRTNDGLGTEQDVLVTGSESLWGTAVWDTDSWSDVRLKRVTVGLLAFGNYCSVRLTHSNGSQRFGLVSGALRHRPLNYYRGT